MLAFGALCPHSCIQSNDGTAVQYNSSSTRGDAEMACICPQLSGAMQPLAVIGPYATKLCLPLPTPNV